jgi:hypothetical protein
MKKEAVDGLILVSRILGVLAVIGGLFYVVGGITFYTADQRASQQLEANWQKQGFQDPVPSYMMVDDSFARLLIVYGGVFLMIGADLLLIPRFFRGRGRNRQVRSPREIALSKF